MHLTDPPIPHSIDSAARILIVGAGLGGIAAAIELTRRGFSDLVVLEAADGIGGTWHANTYPGAACDVPAHLYSFSFAQRTDWERSCSSQAELLRYVRAVADEHGVTPRVRLGRRVAECRYDERRAEWAVRTDGGETYVADAVVLATGQLSRPAIPALPGRGTFAGTSFHTARWDHDCDLRGRRVAVVGTGASAVQLVPPVARAAARLTVFQRHGSWVLPRSSRAYPRSSRALFAHVPGLQRLRRAGTYVAVELLTRAIVHPRTVGRLAGRAAASFMRAQLPDPELRRRAWPDYPFGCKRVLFSSSYLRALGRDDVELVTEPLEAVTPAGLRTVDGVQREFDCIIWATGFHSTEFVAPMRVLGIGGASLAEAWRDGARAHLGIATAGFPSLFLMYGPNTNSSGGSIIVFLEAQARYLAQALAWMRSRGYRSAEVRRDVEARFDAATQSRFDGTAWSACDSWYRDASGRIVTNWPGTMGEYVAATAAFDPEQYVLRR